MSGQQNSRIQGLDLSDDRYTAVQSPILKRYKALDSDGSVILRHNLDLLDTLAFSFTDADGNELFKIKEQVELSLDWKYTLYNARTGAPLVTFENEFSMFQDTWTIWDAQTGGELAEINSRGRQMGFIRQFVPFGKLIPPKYEIVDHRGEHVGQIKGVISDDDRYEISLDNTTQVPKEPVVIGALIIDVLSGPSSWYDRVFLRHYRP